MEASRIPGLTESTSDGMLSQCELLFPPGDSPDQKVKISTCEPIFYAKQCGKLESILSWVFEKFWHDVHEAAYPIFMRRFNGRFDA